MEMITYSQQDQLAAVQALCAGFRAADRCLAKAEEEMPGFGNLALAYLKVYAHKHQFFTAEEVTDAARASGLRPHNTKAWGPVFQRATRNKVIARSLQPYRRKYGHGSPSFMWQSLVFGV